MQTGKIPVRTAIAHTRHIVSGITPQIAARNNYDNCATTTMKWAALSVHQDVGLVKPFKPSQMHRTF
jgi:hypothetical protein